MTTLGAVVFEWWAPLLGGGLWSRVRPRLGCTRGSRSAWHSTANRCRVAVHGQHAGSLRAACGCVWVWVCVGVGVCGCGCVWVCDFSNVEGPTATNETVPSTISPSTQRHGGVVWRRPSGTSSADRNRTKNKPPSPGSTIPPSVSAIFFRSQSQSLLLSIFFWLSVCFFPLCRGIRSRILRSPNCFFFFVFDWPCLNRSTRKIR